MWAVSKSHHLGLALGGHRGSNPQDTRTCIQWLPECDILSTGQGHTQLLKQRAKHTHPTGEASCGRPTFSTPLQQLTPAQ